MSPAASPTARRSHAIRSLLDIENLPAETIAALLKLARRMQGGKTRPVLRGKTVALLFYEASTRTRVSFELAAKKLGGMTTLVTAAASSIQKGESLLDTVYTLRAAGADAIVMRHPASGAPQLAARHLDIPVINAGDGMHEHPTQALLDAFTMLRHKKSLRGLRVSIIGDILHSRVARSNAYLLSKFGAQITFCGPPELAPDVCATLVNGIRLTRHMDDALRGADVGMMLRVQKQRLAGLKLDLRRYIAGYQITGDRPRLVMRDAIVMHRGQMLRGMEVAGDIADGQQSVIREQVANGVAVRMAVLAWALGAAR